MQLDHQLAVRGFWGVMLAEGNVTQASSLKQRSGERAMKVWNGSDHLRTFIRHIHTAPSVDTHVFM